MARYGNTLIATAIRPDVKLGKLTTNMIGKHYAHEDGYDGYDVAEFLPQQLTATEKDFWCGNLLKTTQVFDETVTEVTLHDAKYVFPNLSIAVIGNTEQVVTGLDTAFAGLNVTVIVPNTLLSAYQSFYASSTNLTFDSWMLGQVVTIPFIGETTLTSEYVELYASTAGGDPTQVIKVIVPVDFTEYESGSITAIIQAFQNLETLTTCYEAGNIDLEVGGEIWNAIISDGKSVDSSLVAARAASLSSSVVKGLSIYPPKDNFDYPAYGPAGVQTDYFANTLIYAPHLKGIMSSIQWTVTFSRTTKLIEIHAEFTNTNPSLGSLFQYSNAKRIFLKFAEGTQAINYGGAFSWCRNLEEITLENFTQSISVSDSTKFTRQSLVDLINSLGTPSTQQTLTIGATNLAKLTADDIAIATAKNWQLA